MATAKRKHAQPSGEVVIPEKLYFRIGEVSELASLPTYVLRYWETEFPQLRPTKSTTGQRMYRRRDVEHVMLIRKLLYEDGFTIAGARERLRELRASSSAASIEAGSAAEEASAALSSVSVAPADIEMAEPHAEATAPHICPPSADVATRDAEPTPHALITELSPLTPPAATRQHARHHQPADDQPSLFSSPPAVERESLRRLRDQITAVLELLS